MIRVTTVNLWLDDIRTPPEGYLHVKTIEEAKAIILSHTVQNMSLDHDLGACEDCLGGRTAEEWSESTIYQSMPHCSHIGTGYDFCLWMAEKGVWPTVKPVVHSANPVGRDRMRGVIDRYYPNE